MTSVRKGLLLSIVGLSLTMLVPACTTVKPWQRSGLMRRVMKQPVRPAEGAHDVHVHRTREAMLGASARGGPACGCN